MIGERVSKRSRRTARGDPPSRAVTPVVGIVLIVGITVLLAGVSGAMLLGVGDALNDDGTQVNFDVEYDEVEGATTNSA